MKRVGSLLAVVSIVSAIACAGAGDEAWSGQGVGEAPALQSQEQGIESPPAEPIVIRPVGTADVCVPPEDPVMPTVPTTLNLDEWNFTSSPLLSFNSLTRSLYLVAFQSPVDRMRVYVYGIDVRAGRFVFSGTVARANVPKLTARAGIDIGNYQLEGPTDPFSGIVIQIEGPPPPPPQPAIHDFSVQNYGKIAWHVAVSTDVAAKALSN